MIKKFTIIIVLALLYLNFNASAQKNVNSKPLRVGDNVSADFWQQEYEIYNAGKITSENLSAYKDQLIIFDFWATWCGSCLNKFPHLEKIQAKYQGKLKIILVNSIGTQDKLIDISERLEGKRDPFIASTLPSILKDTALLKDFPHYAIPHYAWIANNEVCAITTAEFIDEGNIDRLLERARKARESAAELKRRREEKQRKTKN